MSRLTDDMRTEGERMMGLMAGYKLSGAREHAKLCMVAASSLAMAIAAITELADMPDPQETE